MPAVLIHSGVSHVGRTWGRQTTFCGNQYQPLNVKAFVTAAQKEENLQKHLQGNRHHHYFPVCNTQARPSDIQQWQTNRQSQTVFLAPDRASFTACGHGLPCRERVPALHHPAARPNSHRLQQMSISLFVSANMCQITQPFLLQMSGTCTHFQCNAKIMENWIFLSFST